MILALKEKQQVAFCVFLDSKDVALLLLLLRPISLENSAECPSFPLPDKMETGPY